MEAIERAQTESWAVAAPLICAVHCLAAPLFVAVLPALAPSAATEWALLGLTVLLGGWVLTQGTKQHGRRVIWFPAGAGMAVWAMSLAEVFPTVPEVVTTVAGSLLVAGALVTNGWWTRHAGVGRECAC